MSSDFNIRLGRGKGADEVDLNSMKSGIKKEDVGEEFASIFEALDADGQTKGVLEQSEIENFKQQVTIAKGKNNKFTKHEANKMLSRLGLKGKATAETFFEFLKKVIGMSSDIESSSTDKEGNTTVLYKEKDGSQLETTTDKDGNTTQTVQYQNKGKENETYQYIKDGQVVGGKDSYGKFTQVNTEDGYTIQYEDGVEKTFIDDKEVAGKTKDGKKYTMENKSGTDRGIEYDQIQVLEGSTDKRYYKNGVWVGGTDGFRSYTITKNGNTMTQTFGDGQVFTEQYDEQGRLIERKRGDGFVEEHRVYDEDGGYTVTSSSDESYSKYNNKGLLTEYNQGENVYTITYDEKGREISRQENGEEFETTTYDDETGSYTQTYTDGNVYEYNSHGDLTRSVSDGEITEWEYQYDDQGRIIAEREKGQEEWDTTEYKPDGGRIEKEADGYELEYDSHGNNIRYKNADGDYSTTTTYEYDDQGRILNETRTTTYGTPGEEQSDEETITYTYNTDGSYKKDNGSSVETYDAYGKQLTKEDSTEIKTHNYDEQGRFKYKEVKNKSTGRIKYEGEYSSEGTLQVSENGDYLAHAKNGETLEATIERLFGNAEQREKLGITDEDIEEFKAVNKKNIGSGKKKDGTKVSYFYLSDNDDKPRIIIPKAIAEKLDKKNLLVDSEEELKKYRGEE